MTTIETTVGEVKKIVIKDRTHTLTKDQLIDLKKRFKDIKLSILPCYGDDTKAIRSHLDSLDLLIDLYLKQVEE